MKSWVHGHGLWLMCIIRNLNVLMKSYAPSRGATKKKKKELNGDSFYCTVWGGVDLVHWMDHYNRCITFKCNDRYPLYTKNNCKLG